MASFKQHYNLCALLGAHNLVGISPDKDENTILATLSSNVVVKHKLTDQKPLKSWSTRQSNNLTSPCIYDSNSDKYAGVINKKYIILWNDDDTNLEDVKKYQFSTDIHAILSSPGKPSIVLFSNGYSEILETSMDKRKEEKPNLLCAGDVICKAYLENIKDQSIIVMRSNNRVYLVRLGNDGAPIGNLHFELHNTNTIKDSKILATTVVSKSNITVLALWSDGSLTEYSEQGQVVASHTLKGVSLSCPVVMATLDPTHIAIYGADVSEEGALLYLFDLKFGMTVATKRLKVFCDPPHLYCHPKNSALLLCVIQNLVVAPYILKPSLLWNLVSGEQQHSESRSKPNVTSWGSAENEELKVPFTFDSKEVNKAAVELWESNASTHVLFDELLPVLKDKNDLAGIHKMLAHVKDVPEQWLADLLNFALERIKNYSELSSHPKEASLLDILLSISYCDAILLNHIRRKLTITSTIKLLHHLHRLSMEVPWTDDTTSSSKPNMHQIIDWIALILDAHHNELLITGEDAEVQQLLRNLDGLITRHCKFLDTLGQSEALIKLLESNRKPPENRRKDWYAIEVVRLL